jgi:hypothetical protein
MDNIRNSDSILKGWVLLAKYRTGYLYDESWTRYIKVLHHTNNAVRSLHDNFVCLRNVFVFYGYVISV